jgi:hypothetical protein
VGIFPGLTLTKSVVGGNAALEGALQVSLINGFAPKLGDSFDILDWGYAQRHVFDIAIADADCGVGVGYFAALHDRRNFGDGRAGAGVSGFMGRGNVGTVDGCDAPPQIDDFKIRPLAPGSAGAWERQWILIAQKNPPAEPGARLLIRAFNPLIGNGEATAVGEGRIVGAVLLIGPIR